MYFFPSHLRVSCLYHELKYFSGAGGVIFLWWWHFLRSQSLWFLFFKWISFGVCLMFSQLDLGFAFLARILQKRCRTLMASHLKVHISIYLSLNNNVNFDHPVKVWSSFLHCIVTRFPLQLMNNLWGIYIFLRVNINIVKLFRVHTAGFEFRYEWT